MVKVSGMVDVSVKEITVRTAKASGKIVLGDKAYEVVEIGTCIKGDVFATAKKAAIRAAKLTQTLIPMCHPVLIESVNIYFVLDKREKSVTVIVTVKKSGKTGVEMEALSSTCAACLTIYDMLKYVGKDMVIKQIMLQIKTGGKSGNYKRQN